MPCYQQNEIQIEAHLNVGDQNLLVDVIRKVAREMGLRLEGYLTAMSLIRPSGGRVVMDIAGGDVQYNDNMLDVYNAVKRKYAQGTMMKLRDKIIAQGGAAQIINASQMRLTLGR
jgi:hypothetical protein